MSEIKTVKVKAETASGFMIINKCDFDKAKHTHYRKPRAAKQPILEVGGKITVGDDPQVLDNKPATPNDIDILSVSQKSKTIKTYSELENMPRRDIMIYLNQFIDKGVAGRSKQQMLDKIKKNSSWYLNK